MTRIYEKLGGAKEVYAFQTTFQGDALDPFIQGKVAMKIDGVWVMSSLAFYGRDLNFGAAPAAHARSANSTKGRAPDLLGRRLGLRDPLHRAARRMARGN